MKCDECKSNTSYSGWLELKQSYPVSISVIVFTLTYCSWRCLLVAAQRHVEFIKTMADSTEETIAEISAYDDSGNIISEKYKAVRKKLSLERR